MGIAPDLLPRIFDVFVASRDADGRSRDALGTGLDLLRRGPRSRWNGFCFEPRNRTWYSMPGRVADDCGEERFVVTSSGITPGAKARVLVVDDYPDSAEIASMLLTLYGHECRTAVNGLDALAQAAEFQPDIVILDIGLPDISGYEVARTLRARAGSRPLYLAAVTGWGQPEDRVRAFAAGFDQHVLKPADAAKIRGILQLAADRTQTPPP
jgi:CheY-like chemotaxis protein